MPRFGDYETTDEYHRSADAIVWQARAVYGRPKELFAVKVFRNDEWPDAEAGAAAQPSPRAAAFVEAAQELQQMGDHRSDRWVPVYAVEPQGSEPWYVTRFYPRSLERVIDGRVQIDGPTLHWIVSSIVAGLADLEREFRRPHGNLRPSNIFIDGGRGLRQSPLLLSDLKPRCDLVLPADQIDDFQALARIVVQLVRQRRTDRGAVITGSLEAGGEWKRLGRHGEAWRELCNHLLNPAPTAADLDLAALDGRLRKLGRAGKRKPWVALALTALPLCVVAGGAVYLRFTPYEQVPERLRNLAERLGNVPPDEAKVPVEWGLLCGTYNEWLGAFLKVAENPVKTGAWARDPYLQEKVLDALANARGRNGSFDPHDFDEHIRGSLTDLQANPPDAARRGTVVRRVRDAYATVQQVQQALADWPARKKLQDLATRFEALGWKQPADELRKVAEDAGAPVLKARVIDQVLLTTALAGRTELLLQELDRQQAVLAGTGDPVLKELVPYYRARTNGADTVAALNRQLGDALQDVNRKVALVQNDWPARIAHDRFMAESFVHDFHGPVTAETIARWDEEVQAYYQATSTEDPRRTVDWPARWRAIDESIKALAEEEGEGGLATADFRKQAGAARAKADTFLAAPLIRKDLTAIKPEIAKLEDGLRQIEAAARATLFQMRPDAKDWLVKVNGTAFGPPGSAVARAWMEHRDKITGGATAASLNGNLAAFRETRDRYRRLEEFFTALAGPQGAARFGALDDTGLAPELAAELRGVAERDRAAALTELVGGIAWDGDVPRDPAKVYLGSPEVRALMARQAESVRALAELGRDAQRTAETIEQGGGLADGAAALAEKWRAHAAVAQAAAGSPLRRVADEIAQLQGLEHETNVATLVAAVRAPQLGIALAGWRKLGTIPNWPDPAGLAEAADLAHGLRERVARGVSDQARRTAVQDDLAAEARRLWRTALHQAHDQASIGTVSARREEFGVTVRDLSAREQFNLFVGELKQADLRSLSVDELEARKNETIERLRAMAGLMPDADVRRFADELAAVSLGHEAGGSGALARLGPGAAGWTGEVVGDGRELRYRWRGPGGEHVLVFHLVEAENAAPFFLGAEEVSVGVLIDLLAARRDLGPRFATWLNAVTGGDEDQRSGPQVWRYRTSQGLRLNDRWTSIPLPSWPKPLYTDGVAVAAGPDRELPLQYLPPEAAQFLARTVLGCRLPSPDEWQAVVSTVTEAGHGANVRDQNWLRERDYLSAAGVTLDSPIDSDIFWPRSAGTLKRGRDAQPVAAQTDDGYLWFAEVEHDTQPRFHHLFGNVAEFLYDEAQQKYFVAGGSALSPPELDPAKAYPVDPAFATGGFADVGLRLAFDAPGSLKGRQRLLQLIKNQAFLTL